MFSIYILFSVFCFCFVCVLIFWSNGVLNLIQCHCGSLFAVRFSLGNHCCIFVLLVGHIFVYCIALPMRLAYKWIYYFDIRFLLSYVIWVKVAMNLFFIDCKLRERVYDLEFYWCLKLLNEIKTFQLKQDFETQADVLCTSRIVENDFVK